MVLETGRNSDGTTTTTNGNSAVALRGSTNSNSSGGMAGPVLVRPTSLLPPEKEPVNFQINLIGAPPEVEQLIEHIKAVAEQFLYHWKTFPINLPTPLSISPGGGVGNGAGQTSLTVSGGSNVNMQNSLVGSSGSRKTRPINLRDLFIARPSTSWMREFEVPSLNFPGQVHRWRLSQFLQKGSERTRDSLLSDLALSARFIVITAKGRLTGHFFSVAHAIRALLQGLIKLVDMVVGVPSLLAHNLDNKIKEERCRFLVAELVCRSEYEDCLDSLCSYVRHQLRRATMEKFDVNCNQAQPIPYLYVTPKGQDIDLRLFSKDTMRRALPILVGILEKETRGWFLHFRERLISELRERKMSDAEIEEEVNDAVMKDLDFLTPLSDTDTQFKLEPHAQLDLSRYAEMVQNTSDIMGINGPDLLGNVYAPRGNIQVHSPYLEVSAFNPRSRVMINSRRAEKRNVTTTTVASAAGVGVTTPSSATASAGPTHFHWTLRNWGGGNGQGQGGNRRRNTSYTYSSTTTSGGGGAGGQLNSGSATNSANDSQLDQIRVDLASPEDISLDTDSSRAMFTAAYGTTV
ncbi:AGAP004423-PA-like protein [Anopheles sinensis]|uniref:AGAP004423-PA-like protein n=1 Tax=Anopheles sinensis TaxID=74873 RepID=A0A084WPA7_ANOSI|nr:AGAP004423-PA-like protein [Anopheles sinensis]